MKIRTTTWITFSLVACGLLLGPSLRSQQPAEPEATEATTNTATDQPTTGHDKEGRKAHGVSHDAIVSFFGKTAELKAGDSADAVVGIGANVKVNGDARDAAVAVFGDVLIDGGTVADSVVAVLGNVRIINGAHVKGDVVAVGGTLEISEDSTINGKTENVSIGWLGGRNLERFKVWFVHCFLKMRPLAFQVPWVWAVAGVVFLIYVLVAAVMPRPVLGCIGELTRRPVTTLVLGGVSLILLSVIFLLLAATGVGLILVPFLFAAVVFGLIIGKVATLEWLGLSLARQIGGPALAQPLVGLLLGGLVIAILYLVPVLGLVTFGVLSVWALGCAVTATFTGLRRESPERPTPPAAPAAPTAPAAPASTPGSTAPPTITPVEPAAANPSPSASTMAAEQPLPRLDSAAAEPSTIAQPIATPGMPEVLAYPRAGFWERMGAAVLDFILLGIITAPLHHFLPAMLIWLAYFVAMWTWKGTTIGGIVLGLKVVRTDSGPVTLTTALVRALAGAFSVVVLFLGILWIAWDSEKQGWHDRIAGTVVLKLPRGTPLIMI